MPSYYKSQSYYNYFVLFVFLQIVNLGKLVFDKNSLIFDAKFLTYLFVLPLVWMLLKFCISVSETKVLVSDPLKKFI